MTKAEALVAQHFHSDCSYNGLHYYIVGTTTYRNPNTGKYFESVILHDRYANSTVQAPFADVQITNWKAPKDVIEKLLARAKRAEINLPI